MLAEKFSQEKAPRRVLFISISKELQATLIGSIEFQC